MLVEFPVVLDNDDILAMDPLLDLLLTLTGGPQLWIALLQNYCQDFRLL